MLVNFCQEFLKTTVTCDTITTEGYEVDNLLKSTTKGFLAYSCIRPPVNIDFIFNCWVRIHHIVVWPRIGAQKSSGFRISVRSHRQEDFRIVSSCFLKATEAGAVFRRPGDAKEIAGPMGFSSAFIGGGQVALEKVKGLRLSIVKTEKSVPAIERVEIWGLVSGCNSQDVAREMGELIVRPLGNRLRPLEQEISEESTGDDFEETTDADQQTSTEPMNSPDIPELFLDPITCSIMQQPVVLPSGKVIDQSTLEKYAESQALWGRPLGDPFTGVPFTEAQRPVFASTLKARIDKFLSENSNLVEIKSMPRVLGSNCTGKIKNNVVDLRKISARTSAIPQTCVSRYSSYTRRDKLPITSIKKYFDSCKIPIVARCSQNSSRNNSQKDLVKSEKIGIDQSPSGNCSRIDDNLESDLKLVMSNLRRFNEDEKSLEPAEKTMNICSCCESCNYYYKFPCSHLICRKKLVSTSTEDLKCKDCGVHYSSSKIERINT
ncbi:RING finger protein 37 [Diachasma alloeum]|uniref:RING finger protein 37 n=1 Tax=Diachasma alloeum TaxID=454923 RepID=UPI0007383CC2|nr:RING finger protein 37 [Diachasma alloeum]